MGRQENKRKKYYKSAGKKVARMRQTLDAGLRGFLLTCANNKERDCVREAYSLLNTYADKIHGPEKADTDSEQEEDDPDVALQKEVAAIKSTNSSERRFQALDTKCKNVIFVKTLLEHPEELLEAIMCDLIEKKYFSTLQICRIMPVIGTCKANIKSITEFAEEVLEPFFTTKCHSFSIHVKIRNNSSLTRNDILPVMGHVIKSMNPGNTVNLDKPDYVVSFDVLTSVACISVMPCFEERCKYNLQEITCKIKTDDLKKETGLDEKSGESANVSDEPAKMPEKSCDEDTTQEQTDIGRDLENLNQPKDSNDERTEGSNSNEQVSSEVS